MSWKKKGLIFVPEGSLSWSRIGAQLPTVDVVENKFMRVYFGSKDADGYGRTGCVDLDVDDPQKILSVAAEPVLDLGELGAFDDCGAVPNSIIEFHGQKHLYYQGFQRTERVPYLTFTGLAQSDSKGEHFRKYARVPIMDRTDDEPFIKSTPCVVQEGDTLKMWYVSTLKWTRDHHGVHYICVIKYATSQDGIAWKTHEGICLEPVLPDEYAVGRPAVIRDGSIYRMWYSIRSFKNLYTLGYAESVDGVMWQRKDEEVGLHKSETGWDSEMICYPYLVEAKGRRLMFYNGNGRGISGFGYAEWE